VVDDLSFHNEKIHAWKEVIERTPLMRFVLELEKANLYFHIWEYQFSKKRGHHQDSWVLVFSSKENHQIYQNLCSLEFLRIFSLQDFKVL
jgi:hypothetical protein